MASITNSLIKYGVPPAHAKILSAVAQGESGLNPRAIGDQKYGGSVGLFQINLPAHADKLKKWTGTSNRQDWVKWLQDPDNNIFAASQVYKSQGLGAWTVYRSGAYKKYLSRDDVGYSSSGPVMFPRARPLPLKPFNVEEYRARLPLKPFDAEEYRARLQRIARPSMERFPDGTLKLPGAKLYAPPKVSKVLKRKEPTTLKRLAESFAEGVVGWVPPEVRKFHGMIKGIPPERIEEYARVVEPRTTAEHIARLGGEILPISGAYKLAALATRPLAAKAVTPIAKIGLEALRGAGVGVPYTAATAYTRGAPGGEIAKEAATAAPLWGLGDVAVTGAMRYPLLALPVAGAGAIYGGWRAHKEGQPVGPGALAGALVAGGGAALLSKLHGAHLAGKEIKAQTKAEEEWAALQHGERRPLRRGEHKTYKLKTYADDEIRESAKTLNDMLRARGDVEEKARLPFILERLKVAGVPAHKAKTIAEAVVKPTEVVRPTRFTIKPAFVLTEEQKSSFIAGANTLRDAFVDRARKVSGTEAMRQNRMRATTFAKIAKNIDEGTVTEKQIKYLKNAWKQLKAEAEQPVIPKEAERGLPTTPEAQGAAKRAVPTAPKAEELSPYINLDKIRVEDADKSEQLVALHEYWSGKTYKDTPQGGTTIAGKPFKYSESNAAKAAVREKRFKKILNEVGQTGYLTKEQIDTIDEGWRLFKPKLSLVAKTKDDFAIYCADFGKEVVGRRVRSRGVPTVTEAPLEKATEQHKPTPVESPRLATKISDTEVLNISRKVEAALSKKGIEVEDIYVVGSRVKGTHKKISDLDVIVIPKDKNLWSNAQEYTQLMHKVLGDTKDVTYKGNKIDLQIHKTYEPEVQGLSREELLSEYGTPEIVKSYRTIEARSAKKPVIKKEPRQKKLTELENELKDIDERLLKVSKAEDAVRELYGVDDPKRITLLNEMGDLVARREEIISAGRKIATTPVVEEAVPSIPKAPNIGDTITVKMTQDVDAVKKAGKSFTGVVTDHLKNNTVVIKQSTTGNSLRIPLDKAEWSVAGTKEVPTTVSKETKIELLPTVPKVKEVPVKPEVTLVPETAEQGLFTTPENELKNIDEYLLKLNEAKETLSKRLGPNNLKVGILSDEMEKLVARKKQILSAGKETGHPTPEPENKVENILEDLDASLEEAADKLDELANLKEERAEASKDEKADYTDEIKAVAEDLKELFIDMRDSLKASEIPVPVKLLKVFEGKHKPQTVMSAIEQFVNETRNALEVTSSVEQKPLISSKEKFRQTLLAKQEERKLARAKEVVPEERRQEEYAAWNELLAKEGMSEELSPIESPREIREKAFGVPKSKAQLRKQELIDSVLNDLGVMHGSKVSYTDILNHSYVKSGVVTEKEVANALRSHGAKVEDVELYSGISPEGIKKFFEMRKSRKYGSVFASVDSVTRGRGSLPKNQLEMLPIETQKKIVIIDQQLTRVNDRISAFFKEKGVRRLEDLSYEDQDKFDLLITDRENLRNRRNRLRPDVEKILRKGTDPSELSEVLKKNLQTGSIHKGVPIYDKQRKLVGYVFEGLNPTGKSTYIPPEYDLTSYEKMVLSQKPSWYAAHYAPTRDLFGEAMVRPWRNATRLYQQFTYKYEQALEKTLQPVLFDVKARERVYGVLEGKILEGTTKREVEMATQLREKVLDPLSKEFGIPLERYIKDYAPRIRKAGSIREAFPGEVPRELAFFAEMERKGVEFPYETDALTSLLKYIRQGSRKKFFDPVLQRTLPEIARAEVNPFRRQLYLNKVANMLGRPLEEELLLNYTLSGVSKALQKAVGVDLTKAVPDSQKRTAAAISAIMTRAAYSSTLWANPKSWLTNLTQQILAIAAIDPNPVVGLSYWYKAQKLLSTKAGKKLLDYNWVGQNRQYLEAFERIHGKPEDLMGTTYDKVRVGLSKTMSKIESSPLGMGVFESVDLYNVNTSYLMKLLQEIDNGTPFSEAVEASNTFAGSTQFLYGVDSPMFYAHPFGKVLGVLTSYPVNFARLLYEYGVRKGDKASKLKALNILGTLSAMPFVLSASGIDFSREAPMSTIGGLLPIKFALQGFEAAPIVEGVLGAGEAASKYGGQVLNDASVLADPEMRGEAFNELLKTLGIFIPWNTQRRRITKFVKAAKNDWEVLDEQGKLSYRMGEIEGEPARVSTGEIPGPVRKQWEQSPVAKKIHEAMPAGGLLYRATEGRLPGEALRSAIGPTTEQRARYAQHERYGAEKESYDLLRRRATNNYISYKKTGDTKYYDAFTRAQSKLKAIGGNPITRTDIRRRLREEKRTALERQRRMLPKRYRTEG